MSLLGLQLSASVPLLVALIAALLARGWLTALVFGLIGYAVTVVLQPAVLGLRDGSPELGTVRTWLHCRRGGITPQLLRNHHAVRGDDAADLLGRPAAPGGVGTKGAQRG